MKNILIIAPHPDDEVLGCGGMMKKFSEEGHHIFVLIATRGTPSKYSDDRIAKGRLDALNAHAILGVKETFFFEYHAPELDLVSLSDISESIYNLIKKLNIEVLFIPHRGDIHNDHRVIFNASLVAARPVGNYTVKSIYCYETLSETEWAPPFGDDAFIPNYFVNIANYLDFKLRAMACYSGQLREFPNPRSLNALEALSQFRGSTVSLYRAEAFMIIRSIVD